MANGMLMAIFKRVLLVALIVTISTEMVSGQGFSNQSPRKLAKGVITVIRDANIDDATLDEPREFTELLSLVKPREWTPNFDPTTQTLAEKAKKVSFQREVWSLEFGCKPLRVINYGGQNIWYLVYFVRNNSEARTATSDGQSSIQVQGASKPIRFIPTLVLQSHDVKTAYRDSVRSDVVNAIAKKERVTRGLLHDASSVSRLEIPVSTETADRRVWCVATWENVDPRADFLSVYVAGLTNAYRWEPPQAGYKPGEEWREQDVVQSKVLQLNFWRAGDELDLNDLEFRFGIPLYPKDAGRQQRVLDAYKLEKPVQYRWIYR